MTRKKNRTRVVDAKNLPDKSYTQAGELAAKQKLTRRNLTHVLTEMGLTARLNTMTWSLELHGEGISLGQFAQAQAVQEVADVLTMSSIGGAFNDVINLLGTLAYDDPYHPMGEWIDGEKWDGVERIAGLAASVPTEHPLWPVYLRKWMIQVMQAVYGVDPQDPDAATPLEHVLCFTGAQGIGKGRWSASLAPGKYVLTDAELHLNSMGAKDQMLSVLRYPVVELAELDSSFKRSDIAAMKSFLSRRMDTIRAPYARKADERPRGTCFIGTINDTEFLSDPTGSRRYWVIGVDGMLDWNHGINMQQAWAEAAAAWESGESWHLTAEENEVRADWNHEFSVTSLEVDKLDTHLRKHRQEWDNYALMGKAEILECVGLSLSLGGARGAVNQWFKEVMGPARKLRDDDGYRKARAWAFPIGPNFVKTVTPISATRAKKLVLWKEN